MSYICVFAGLYPVLASLYVLYYKQLPLPTQKYLGETGEIAIFQKFYLPNRQFRCTQHDESPLFHSLSSFFQSRLLQKWAHQSVLKFSTKKGNLEQSYTSLSQWQKSRQFFSFNLTIKSHYSLQYPTTTTKCINIRTHYSSAKLS